MPTGSLLKQQAADAARGDASEHGEIKDVIVSDTITSPHQIRAPVRVRMTDETERSYEWRTDVHGDYGSLWPA